MEQNTDSQSPTTRATGVRYGIILGAISIIYFLIFSIFDLDMSQGIGRWGTSIVSLVVIFLAHKYYKDNGDGFMNYGEGVGIAFWVGLVSSVVSSIFTYIYVKFIDDGFIAKIREKAIQDMQDKGQSDEQIDMAMKFVNMFTGAEAMLIMGIVFGVIILVVIGLIISIFTQKARAEKF